MSRPFAPRVIRTLLCALAFVAATGSPVRGQADTSSLNRLVTASLSTVDAQAILGVVSDVEARRLPTSLLVAKVREGIAKRAAGPRILAIVRGYAKSLADARDALGAKATATEIEAAAAALVAGLRSSALRDMRTARPSESLSAPLVTAVDLVTRGVPIDSVSAGIVSLLGSGATDAEFQQLQLQVARSMLNGSSPLPAYRSFLAIPRPGAAATPKRPSPLEDQSTVRVP